MILSWSSDSILIFSLSWWYPLIRSIISVNSLLFNIEVTNALVRIPSLQKLNFDKINPALLPSPPASESVCNIRSTTLASPTFDRSTVPPFSLIYFSIAILVSILKTNFIQPNFIALATPNPSVTSGDNFFPLITMTTLSPSRSYAKPIWSWLHSEIKLVRLSVVGSGPLLLFMSFRVFTSQPIFSNTSFATFFAAPPPISRTVLEFSFIVPTRDTTSLT